MGITHPDQSAGRRRTEGGPFDAVLLDGPQRIEWIRNAFDAS